MSDVVCGVRRLRLRERGRRERIAALDNPAGFTHHVNLDGTRVW
ncbi:hypothetical protein [Ktedonosporobacter rubrisoli]|nr:hypothetical protein [Ktedonosporobacter rubrisoli]